jgi:hypothetical protein
VESAAPRGAAGGEVSESGLACHALEPEAFPVAFEEECMPLLDDALLRSVSPPLAPGRTLAQRLRARRDGLCRIDVHTVTYGLAPAHTLELRLLDEDGALLAASRYAARLAPDRGWLALDVPLQAASRGRSYRFEIRALDAPPGAALSFGLTPAAPGAEPARIDGEDLAGVLRVRGFADSGCALAEVTAAAPARSRG